MFAVHVYLKLIVDLIKRILKLVSVSEYLQM